MRILVLHDSYSPVSSKSISGEDAIVDLEIEVLREKGHEVIDLRQYESGFKHKVSHFLVHTSGTGSKGIDADYLDSFKADIIHFYNLNLRTGYQWLHNTATPAVASLHNFRTLCPVATAWRNQHLCFECRDEGVQRAVINRCGGVYGVLGAIRMGIFDRQRLVLNKSAKIIATSEKMKRELSTLIDESKIDVLGSVSRFPTRKVKRESGKGFVFLGRFAPEKGIKELVLNWPKSENLTLIGQGDIDRAVRETIDKKSIKVRSAEFTNSSDFLDEFEGLVFPSTWLEGSPLVIYEALSISLPVICNSISSASEIFAQSQAGVVIENFSSQAVIQDGINELRTNYNFRQEECLRLSMGKLSRESWGIKLEQILMDSAY